MQLEEFKRKKQPQEFENKMKHLLRSREKRQSKPQEDEEDEEDEERSERRRRSNLKNVRERSNLDLGVKAFACERNSLLST